MAVIIGKSEAETDAIIGKERRLLEALNDYVIQVGVISGDSKERKTVSFGLTNAELLFIHENGSPVKNIPPRPVLQKTIEYARKNLIDKFLDTCFDKIINNEWDNSMLETELGKLCIRIQNYAQQGLLSNTLGLEPDKPSTIKRKGSDIPLVDTGQLARSIVCKYVKVNQ